MINKLVLHLIGLGSITQLTLAWLVSFGLVVEVVGGEEPMAQRTGLYVDVTGLGCYDKKDVPQWYNELNEGPRWEVQARFWEAVAQTCSHSPVVFCYDLMNEPVVTEDKKGRDWTPGAFGDRY